MNTRPLTDQTILKEIAMHNYALLVAEANHRNTEHERRVKVVANDLLTTDPNASGRQSLRQTLAQVQVLPLARLPIRSAPAPRLSHGADRAGC